MTNEITLPKVSDAVKWYHRALAWPLRLLSSFNIGPLGGENSISVVIETVLAKNEGRDIDFELSKTDKFFVNQLAGKSIPDEMIEYRELNHEVQNEILRYWPNEQIDVIWLGAGVFTLAHPLLSQRKKEDWHIWSDASPKVVRDAATLFKEMRRRGASSNLAYDVTLPTDVDRLNSWLEFIGQSVKRLVIMGYGVTYALTLAENYSWLEQLKLPKEADVLFVFNAPCEKIPLPAGVMAAFHHQRMMSYDTESVSALFTKAIPGSEIIWKKPREKTRNKMWETWLIQASADNR